MPPKKTLLAHTDKQSTRESFVAHRNRLKNIKSRIDIKPAKVMTRTFLRIERLKVDFEATKRIMKDNIALLTKINKIQRNQGFVENYNLKKCITRSKYKDMIIRLQTIEKDNLKLGHRLLCAKPSIHTRDYEKRRSLQDINKKYLKRKVTNFNAPYCLIQLYKSALANITTEELLLDRLLRPKIFIDLCIKDIRPLGRIIIQLFTEMCPELVLYFVQVCVHRMKNKWKIIRIFSGLWVESELLLDNHNLCEPGFPYHDDIRHIKDRLGPNTLTFSKAYLNGFPENIINFTISFKELPLHSCQRIPFGVLVSGRGVLNALQDYGTKYGKITKVIEINKCDLVN